MREAVVQPLAFASKVVIACGVPMRRVGIKQNDAPAIEARGGVGGERSSPTIMVFTDNHPQTHDDASPF
jgi:hypothetical protein